jgi:class 3 adenylate cyclase/predicted ATPase
MRDVVDIAAWLHGLGLERYAEAFRDNDVDPEILFKLTAEDLLAIGVTSVGHRRKLLEAIAKLGESEQTADEAANGDIRVDSPGKVSAEAERRQLTVLFCDLVGSTELSARLDPEDMGEVIRRYQESCAELVARWGGHVARYMGDGVLAYFGWPQAHEDDVERAVRAGLNLTQEVGQLTTTDGVPLAARVGIATGLVVVVDLVGEGAAQVVGETPNLAARLQSLAEPGTVVIAAGTRHLLSGLFEYVDLGRPELKGFPGPVQAWRVAGESRAESRFEALHGPQLTVLVGREYEIGLLVDRWERAKEGEGQVVLLSGEPGIGKSRIVRALRERLAGEPHTLLSHYCSPHHTNSALYPVIGLLGRAAGLSRDDRAEVRLGKLEVLLARSTEALGEAVPLIAVLLGIETGERYPAPTLSPQRQKQRTLEVLVDQVEGLAARQPVLAVYEDVHWIDATTLEGLDLLIERVQRLPVLVLITFRPEFSPPWTAHAHVMQLSLSRLTLRHGEALVAAVTGGKALPDAVLDQVLAKTDGVPLFVEELTKTVLESGLLTDAGDHYALSGPLRPLAIPATLHDSLMARLDRLAPAKEIAQTCAVIGREFSLDLVAAVTRLPEVQLAAALHQLVASGLVFRRGTPANASYAFKHALVQDAAYQSLLRSKREQLHARIAAVLEERFPEITAIEPELLAHHFTEAGLSGPAVDYWSKAGERALERSAYAEAVGHLDRGVEVLDHLPVGAERDRRELKLQAPRARALLATRGYTAAETGAAFAQARKLCRELDDVAHIFPVLHGVWACHLARAEHRSALDAAEECLGLAESRADRVAALLAHRLLGQTLTMRGELTAARQHLEQVLALYEPRHHAASERLYGVASKPGALVWLSQVLWILGYPDRAWRVAQDGLGHAGPQGAFDLVHAMFQVCVTRVLRREFQAAHELADEAVELANKHALLQWHLYARLMRDWVRLEIEGRHEAIVRFADSLSALRATGSVVRIPLWLGAQAAALAGVHRGRDAVEAIAEALALTEQSEERWSEAELRRLKGEILLMQDGRCSVGEAEACFVKAMEIARSQEARSWELRAATSLARLWAEQGERNKAHDLLAPVYRWFTEGFDTADLKDAKDLLEALA